MVLLEAIPNRQDTGDSNQSPLFLCPNTEQYFEELFKAHVDQIIEDTKQYWQTMESLLPKKCGRMAALEEDDCVNILGFDARYKDQGYFIWQISRVRRLDDKGRYPNNDQRSNYDHRIIRQLIVNLDGSLQYREIHKDQGGRSLSETETVDLTQDDTKDLTDFWTQLEPLMAESIKKRSLLQQRSIISRAELMHLLLTGIVEITYNHVLTGESITKNVIAGESLKQKRILDLEERIGNICFGYLSTSDWEPTPSAQ